MQVVLRLGRWLEPVGLRGVAQGPRPAFGHRLVEPEVVAAEDADVGVHERGDPGEVLLAGLVGPVAQVGGGLVEVERVGP